MAHDPAQRPKRGKGLTETQKEKVFDTLDDIARSSNGRPCFVVISLIDGVLQLRETLPPVYIPPT